MVTLDDLVEILNKSIFHPKYSWGIPMLIYYSGKNLNSYVIGTGILVALINAFQWVSHYLIRLVSGDPRNLDKDKDVILITGASSGLGRKISTVYAMKGFQVVSLDIEPPDTILPNIHHYECDISCLKDVQEAHKHIKEKIGKVTVLINNAALVGPGSILDLNEDTVEKVVNVNLVSHFWTVKTFLPDMIEMKRGHIVTIGSIIGYFGPAKSSLYCCSKAGLLTFHDSLTHELKNTGVKTLLVTPGQLNSRLFEKVSTPNKFIAPILSTAELAMRITQAVSEGQCGQIFDPIYTRLIPFTVAVLPQAVSDFFRSYLKVDDAMDGFEIMRQSSDLKRINKN